MAKFLWNICTTWLKITTATNDSPEVIVFLQVDILLYDWFIGRYSIIANIFTENLCIFILYMFCCGCLESMRDTFVVLEAELVFASSWLATTFILCSHDTSNVCIWKSNISTHIITNSYILTTPVVTASNQAQIC